jgi:hypothetical protein
MRFQKRNYGSGFSRIDNFFEFSLLSSFAPLGYHKRLLRLASRAEIEVREPHG